MRHERAPEKYLAEHQVAISDAASSSFSLVKIALILGFVLSVISLQRLRFNAGWSFLPVVLISFGLGIVMTLVLEQYRGIAKFGKYMPAIEPAKGRINILQSVRRSPSGLMAPKAKSPACSTPHPPVAGFPAVGRRKLRKLRCGGGLVLQKRCG